MKGQIFSGTRKIWVTVPAVIHCEAEEKIKRIYDVDTVWNVTECDANGNSGVFGSSDSSAGNAMGWLIITGGIFGLWLLIEYWFIVVPILAFIVIAMVWQQFTD